MAQSDFNNYLKQIRKILEELRLPLQSALTKIDTGLKNIPVTMQYKPSPIAPENNDHVAFASGKKINIEKLREIESRNYEDFDIVMNLPAGELRVRQYPEVRSPLIIISRTGVGPYRMKLLLYMLQHPNAPICSNTIDRVYGPDAILMPSSLAKTINILRKTLQPKMGCGSYIHNQMDCGRFLSETGYFYQMNPQWRYLVIERQA